MLNIISEKFKGKATDWLASSKKLKHTAIMIAVVNFWRTAAVWRDAMFEEFLLVAWIRPAVTWLHSVQEIAVPTHLPVTAAQLMRPDIGQNAT